MSFERPAHSLGLIGKAVLFLCMFFLSIAAHSQEEMEHGKKGNVKDMLSDVWNKGGWDLYLSGYAYHSRDTYSEKRIEKLNEEAWGLGFGKTLRNDKGNDDSLYAMGIRDSNRHAQWMAGYAHQWIYPLTSEGDWEVGGGYSALLIKRTDWCDGWPFPAILPLVSIGPRKAKLYATYVPRISTRKGKGDVVLFFGRIEF